MRPRPIEGHEGLLPYRGATSAVPALAPPLRLLRGRARRVAVLVAAVLYAAVEFWCLRNWPPHDGLSICLDPKVFPSQLGGGLLCAGLLGDVVIGTSLVLLAWGTVGAVAHVAERRRWAAAGLALVLGAAQFLAAPAVATALVTSASAIVADVTTACPPDEGMLGCVAMRFCWTVTYGFFFGLVMGSSYALIAVAQTAVAVLGVTAALVLSLPRSRAS
jgi:hypothetical protein